ncbi:MULTISPECIES: tyrosine-type recombinase/integrase [unclassified Sphingomonas]|uniref:tyrosine-type recombinase/integrase n=1 Tax=unclassified Sphingomonas TaxID=196159 RepID=UPI002269C1AE|nr:MULTISPECIES: tyrosine-type recombinase/integrase [unclassified Sphingomonas]
MALENYLFKRKGSQHWQLRWMVPKAARGVIGKAEFTKSLGVTDRRKAEVLAFHQLSKWQAKVALATQQSALAVEQPAVEITETEFDTYLVNEQYDLGRLATPALVRRRYNDRHLPLAEQQLWLQGQVEKINERIFLGEVESYLDLPAFALERRGYVMPSDQGLRRTFATKAALALRDALASSLATMASRPDEYMPSSFIIKEKERRNSEANDGQTIMDLFDRYSAQRMMEKRKRADTVTQDRKIVEQFAEFIGSKRSVASVTATDIRDWRDTVAALPPAFRKWKINDGLTMREAAFKAKEAGLKGVTPTTINKYLSTVSPFLKWCRSNSYIDSDPCNGLFYDLQKVKRRRPPFTTKQLNDILTSPLFVGFERDGKEFIPGTVKADDWRFWVPLVCMFTGARIGEIAQLSLDDVKVQDDLPYLMIRHDEEIGKSTKSGYDRPAAVHPLLIKVGFLKFVDRQRGRMHRDGVKQLFRGISFNERGQAAKCSRFWRTYLQRIGLKEGADGLGAHSFRHTLADQLRLAGYLDDEIEVALGHNQISVTAGYGQVRQGTVARLAKMMSDVEFAGIEISHLIA